MNRLVSTLQRWWTRSCGGREIFIIAFPLVVSMISWTIMNFVDRMFLLWYSDEAMAASLPTGVILFTLICFPMGVAGFANTFVAQYEGSGNPSRIGRVVWQALGIGIISTPFFALTIFFAPAVFSLAGHAPEIELLEVTYFRASALGAGGMVCSVGLSTFYTGRGRTRTVMVVDATAALLNIVLDYLWIFGRGGFPEMGIMGAGLATTISQWYRVVVYAWLMYGGKREDPFGLRAGRVWDGELMGRLLRYGAPEGFRMFVEMGALAMFLLLVGRLGAQAMNATTLAFNVNSVAFVPLLGLGTAVSTLVGQQLGRNNVQLARRATMTALVFGLVYSALMGVLYIATPDLLLWGHGSHANPEEFARLREITIVLLRFVAAYCLLDACCVVFVSAIRGAGDTRFVMIATLAIAPVPVVITAIGLAYWNWGLIACWFVFTCWVSTMGIVFAARYFHGGWESKRVIESELMLRCPDDDDQTTPQQLTTVAS